MRDLVVIADLRKSAFSILVASLLTVAMVLTAFAGAEAVSEDKVTTYAPGLIVTERADGSTKVTVDGQVMDVSFDESTQVATVTGESGHQESIYLGDYAEGGSR